MDSQTLTADRYAKKAEQTAKQSGWAQTDAGLAIAQRYITECIEAVARGRQYLKPREHRDEIDKVPDDVMALVGIDASINAVIAGLEKGQFLAFVGASVEDECYAYGLRTWDQDRYDQIIRKIKFDRGKTLFRRRGMRMLARKAKFPWVRWTFRERALAGRWLMECLLESSMITLDGGGQFALTEEAIEVANRTVEQIQAKHPYLPALDACVALAFIGCLAHARLIEHTRRQLRDITGDGLAGEIGDEIQRGAGLARAPLDHIDKDADAATGILFRQSIDFGFDGGGNLFVEQTAHVPADPADNGAGADGKDHQIGKRQLERRRAEEISERRHGSYILQLDSHHHTVFQVIHKRYILINVFICRLD